MRYPDYDEATTGKKVYAELFPGNNQVLWNYCSLRPKSSLNFKTQPADDTAKMLVRRLLR
jgi:hypothetical protein